MVGGILDDGTIVLGTGFTVTHAAEGEYEVAFPPGTWTDLFSVVVTPLFSASVAGLNVGINGDGSGGMAFTLSGDVPFTVIAMQVGN